MLTLITINLYATSNCHLCEQALQQIENSGLIRQLTIVEIIDDPLLLEMYGSRIPVIQRTDSLAELDWPFDSQAIVHFMDK